MQRSNSWSGIRGGGGEASNRSPSRVVGSIFLRFFALQCRDRFLHQTNGFLAFCMPPANHRIARRFMLEIPNGIDRLNECRIRAPNFVDADLFVPGMVDRSCIPNIQEKSAR